MEKKVVIIGAGYVGLVTAACFADAGIEVIVVERNEEKLKLVMQGQSPFFEPGLDALLAKGFHTKKLQAVSAIAQAVSYKPTFIFICVGTPSLADGSVDMSAVTAVAQEIGATITDDCIVVNKSTVPVGTVAKVKALIDAQLAQRALPIAVSVASSPEFLREGSAVSDTQHPDRVIVGTESSEVAQQLKKLYTPFITSEDQFLVMKPASAELAKYTANTMLALRISYMNQIAQLAEAIGADITEVKRGIAKDKRIGSEFLNAGIGYGGSCFPKDVKGLSWIGKLNNISLTLAQVADAINDAQRNWFIQKILKFYGSQIDQKTIGIWGLAFKPYTDDIRCAPALDVIEQLLQANARVVVYDPVAMQNVKAIFGERITYADTARQVLEHSDALVLLTEWPEFVQIDLTIFNTLRDATVFDARNVYDPLLMNFFGINYCGIGRPGSCAVLPESSPITKMPSA
jgi:UDPglucose 6-dehydrogenase